MKPPVSPVAILDLALDHILESERLREVDLAEADKIAVSFKEIGQITPIEVRPNPLRDGYYVLVAGSHRLAAAQRLGWETIRAVVFKGNGDAARLREIDENLLRHELTPYDQANFLFERRKVWERLYGEIKRGRDSRSIKRDNLVPFDNSEDQRRFIRDTAAQLDVHPKTVKRSLTRKWGITEALWSALRGSPEAKNAAFLDRLRLKFTKEQQEQIVALVNERGCSISYAVGQVKRPTPPDVEASLLAEFIKAWRRSDDPGHEAARKAVQAWGKAR